MISLEFFLAICSSLWIGVKLTIFFKRRFRWRDHFFSRLRLNSVSLILIIAAQFLLPMIIARLDCAKLYSHNRCAVFAADDNSSDSYGLGYHGHVLDDD